MPATIVVVDDDHGFFLQVQSALLAQGWSVEQAPIENAECRIGQGDIDLVVLDFASPLPQSGLPFLARIRGRSKPTPVIVATAINDVASRVRALDMGADDYMAKPLAPEELVARIRGVLRTVEQRRSRWITVGSLSVDPLGRRVHAEGAALDLTAMEFAVFLALATSPDRVVARERMASRLLNRTLSDPANEALLVQVRSVNRRLAR